MQNKLRGTGVALVTPFTKNNEIDYPALGRLVDHVTTNGVDYLVVLGTTAETPTLSSAEKQTITEYIVKQNANKLPIVLGIGGNSTSELINQINNTNLKGIDAILSVTPYYNKPSQQGLYAHYEAVCNNSPLPIVLYNVPGRTGVNMTAETTLKLAHNVKNIAGIKDAGGNISQTAYILRDRPKDFLVISGDDGLAMPQIAIGADGVISVAANAFAKDFSKMIQLALQGKTNEAAQYHLNLIEVVDMLFAEGNPAGVKAALSALKITDYYVRLPLTPASETLCQKLKNYIIQKNG